MSLTVTVDYEPEFPRVNSQSGADDKSGDTCTCISGKFGQAVAHILPRCSLSQNVYGETKQTQCATKAYQKDTMIFAAPKFKPKIQLHTCKVNVLILLEIRTADKVSDWLILNIW